MPGAPARVLASVAAAALVAVVATGCGEPTEPATDSASLSPTAGASPSPTTGSSPATSPTSGRTRVLTPADDGTLVELVVGDIVELHIPDPLSPEVVVTGDAIEAAENVSGAGIEGRRWEIRALRRGEAAVSGTSDGREFEIRFRVR